MYLFQNRENVWMDAFENFLEKIAALDEKDRAAALIEQNKRCICGRCPTYNECMREQDELIYCIIGRSPMCSFEKKGCICPTCPVKEAIGLKKAYHCVRGSETEQRRAPPVQKPS
jgi:hypothetical protein